MMAPLPAFAHVILAEPQARPGSQYNAHFKIGHGCDGSPTVALTITMPDDVSMVAPQEKPGWKMQVTRRDTKITAVTYSGGRLAGDMPGEFIVIMTLPDKLGPLAFPATQTCEKGSESWSELPAADGHKLQNPAPLLTLTKTPVNNGGMAGMDMKGMNMPGMQMGDGKSGAPAGVTVKDAWIRALPTTSGGYFTLHNGGSKQVVLTGASSPGCGMLMLHKSEDKGGMSGMSDVQEIPVAAGADVQFTPGSFHLMCMDTKPVIKPGASVPVTLIFTDGGRLTTQFPVRNAAGK
jgi:copper(I)-binding protein/uncharacterized protein YcnI